MSGRFGNATAIAMATMIRTDNIPASTRPPAHSTMHSSHFRALAPELALWDGLVSLAGDLEGIKNLVDTRCHYKNDVFIALARQHLPLIIGWLPRACRPTDLNPDQAKSVYFWQHSYSLE